MLEQVIHTMRDASTLPWDRVCEAYAFSMHDVEEGRLTWQDTVKWSFNRLDMTRLHTQQQQPSQTFSSVRAPASNNASAHIPDESARLCIFNLEGRCDSKIDHGVFMHDVEAYKLKKQRARGKVHNGRYIPNRTSNK